MVKLNSKYMKQVIFVILGLLFASNLLAQSNISQPMDFHIEKEVLPPMLDIVPGSVKFMDADNNTGGSVQKIEDQHRMAEPNKAFAHFRF